MTVDVFDELEARLVRIEETLQIAGGPLIGGTLQHANITADADKHTPKLHKATHERTGVDEIKTLPIQIGDLEVVRDGASLILDDDAGSRYRFSVALDGTFEAAFWDSGGTAWVPLSTTDASGNQIQVGDLGIGGNFTLSSSGPLITFVRTGDLTEYRISASVNELDFQVDTGGGFVSLVKLPKTGFTPGDMWVSNDAGEMVRLPISVTTGHVLSADLTSDPKVKWITPGGGGGGVAGNVPVGGWCGWAGSGDPGVQADGSVFFIADGRQLLTGDHAELFAAIGYTYGGSGGTFNLPDFQGKFPLGADPGNTGYELADTGGSLGHTHTYSDLPQHTHTGSVSSHSHGFSVPAHTHTVTDPGHSHGGSVGSHSHTVNDGGHGHSFSGIAHDHNNGDLAAGNHNHPNTASLKYNTTSIQDTGSGLTVVTGVGSGGSTATVDMVNGNTSGTNVTGRTADTTAGGTVSSATTGITLSNTAPSLSISNADANVTVNSGGGHTGNTDPSGATLSVDQAGVASPVTDGADPAFLGTNIVIRVT